MKTPDRDRSVQVHVLYGQYVTARCTRSKQPAFATQAKAATKAYRDSALAVDEREADLQFANAERDAIADDMSETAREANLQLVGRSLDARKVGPHPRIFGETIAYFTVVSNDERRLRGEQLVERVEEFLEPDDAVRVQVVDEMGAHLEAWDAAVEAVEEAKKALDISRIRREEALDAWEAAMRDIYATLLKNVGKRKAEQHFPKNNRKPKKAPPTATTEKP